MDVIFARARKMCLAFSPENLAFCPDLTQDKSVLSIEHFRENYRRELARRSVPLIYARQSYHAVGDSGLHLHVDHYALYFVHRGRGVHEISGHPYGISRGDVYLAPPGSIHAYRDGENLEVDAFCFQIDLFHDDEIAALRALPGFRGLFFDEADWSFHRLHLTPERMGEIEIFVAEIVDELRAAESVVSGQWSVVGDGPGVLQVEAATQYRQLTTDHRPPGVLPSANMAANVLARVLFFRLLVVLARLWKENAPALKNAIYRNVELADVVRFCEAHFADEISVPLLASKMFLSSSRFGEIFKAEMGVPPGEYLRNLRLDRAQTLLKTSRKSATEIAADCGFRDASQFSRAFKSAFGKSPSEYRREF